MASISGPFKIDWQHEDLEIVRRTILKKYNAEVHSQSAIECILEMKNAHAFAPSAVRKIEMQIFDVAYHIIGGGEEGEKTHVETKEQADHSLPYLIAVAVLDGKVMPEQYEPARIRRRDVQQLMRRVSIRPSAAFSKAFPRQMPCRITIHFKNGQRLIGNKFDYPGFVTKPMSWKTACAKFESLTSPYSSIGWRREVLNAVEMLERIQTEDLIRLLSRVRQPKLGRGTRRAA